MRPEAQELVANHSNDSQSSARALFQQTDVRDWKQLERMLNVAKTEFGDVDVVCPGAGVYEPVSLQLSFANNIRIFPDEWKALFQLLASTRLTTLERCHNLFRLRQSRHQPHPSHPYDPARSPALPGFAQSDGDKLT